MRNPWETHVFGVLAVTQAFVPLLRKSEAARIVSVSSTLGSLTLNSAPNPYRASQPRLWRFQNRPQRYHAAFGHRSRTGGDKRSMQWRWVTPAQLTTITEALRPAGKELPDAVRSALSSEAPTGTFTGAVNETYRW